jgi:hypothetical protein
MSQMGLFDASVYVRKAYDALVLAYNEAELEEIAVVKSAVLRAYVGLEEAAHAQLELPASEDDWVEAQIPF